MLKSLIKNSFDEERYLTYLQETFEIEINRGTKKLEKSHDYIASYQELGSLEASNEIDEIGFFLVEAKKKNIENIRVGFNQFIQNLIKTGKYSYDGLIVAIYHPESDVWRLSYVALELDENRQLATNPKRYTFELGNTQTKTALERLSHLDKNTSLEQIQDIFSVERLSNSFFNAYKKLYYELVQRVVVIDEDEASQEALKDKQAVASYLKKMLGRIVFLYFVQKKGWLDGNKKFLSELFFGYTQKHPKINFYDEIMEKLFFDALNSKRDDDTIELGDHNYKIPYLNGGLFEEDSYDKLDIAISNEDLRQILELFDSYNFTVIEDTPHDSEVAVDPEMLGRVFEDLLEDRKEKGAFYTPREIVHYMCQESINNYLENKPKELSELEYLKKIKVLDPAIGSGAFPMGMLHEIMEKRVALGDNTPLGELKKEIIQNAIYGVDIEPSAVEIAKLRFWLSIVVDELEPSPLPNLAYKIMIGNSLMETIHGFNPLLGENKNDEVSKKQKENINKLKKHFNEYYKLHENKEGKKEQISVAIVDLFDTKHNVYSNQGNLLEDNFQERKVATQIEKVLKEIKNNHFSNKIFLYKLFFKEVMDNGGFNIVIGNPPYLRVQGIDKEASEQYKKQFDSATGKYDLYVLFVEKGLSLLAKDGILNYIMPHKWINSAFGKGLREISKENLLKFISFGAYQVFNASTYTSLVWFKNSKVKTLEYVESDRDLLDNKALETYLFGLKDDDYSKIKNRELGTASWVFTDKKTYDILQKLNRQSLRVEDCFKYVSTGIFSNGDEVFFLQGNIENNLFKGYSKGLMEEIIIEADIMKPLLLGDDVKRYSKIVNTYYVIYPHYITSENKTKPYEEKELKSRFPLAYKYFCNFKEELTRRKIKNNNNSTYWYALNRARQIEMFEQAKIITPEISLGSNMSLDENHFYGNTQNYNFVKFAHVKESYKFYLAIFNSKLLWFFVKNTGSVLASGYFRFKTNYLNPFPLPKIENSEDTKPFEILVDKILQEKEQGNDTLALEQKIDRMVYELYGLSDEEIEMIEESI